MRMSNKHWLDYLTAERIIGLLLWMCILGPIIFGHLGSEHGRIKEQQRWQQQLIEKDLGRWIIDPATGAKSFEVGHKGRE